jgi:hypothetical protein
MSIKLYTNSTTKTGNHTVTVTIGLENYPNITQALPPFNIEVLPCIVDNFLITSIPDQVYVIGNPLMSLSLVGSQITTQEPACGYTVDLVQIGAPTDFVNVTSGSTLAFSAFTRNLTY